MTNEIQKFIARLTEGKSLTRDESAHAFQIVMNGGATPAVMATLLTALRMKGETVDEITGAALAMRAKMQKFPVPADVIDTCGTGGDAKGTLNVSTAVALVVAGCGVPVAKHGNRAISSSSGSADVLKALGVHIEAKQSLWELALKENHFCFLLATHYHPAMRHVAPVRQELGMRTIFNILGPLCNPASPKRQLMGVYDAKLTEPLAQVLLSLGSTHAWVVHGEDGTDELSISGASHVAELKDGSVRSFTVTPEDAGLTPSPTLSIKGGNAVQNAKAIEYLLAGAKNPYRDVVLLNTAAALIIAGKTTDLKEGVSLAEQSIDSGNARTLLSKLVQLTNSETAYA